MSDEKAKALYVIEAGLKRESERLQEMAGAVRSGRGQRYFHWDAFVADLESAAKVCEWGAVQVHKLVDEEDQSPKARQG